MNRVLYTPEQVNQGISEMAERITIDHPKTPVFVALLRGAAPFAGRLMFEITQQNPDYHPELDYMTVSTYGQTTTARTPRIVTDISPKTKIEGREVIIVDDTLDTGVTAEFVRNHLTAMGARVVQTAVLVNKLGVRPNDSDPDYFAFTAGPEWLTGMGLDDPRVAVEAGRWDGAISVVD